MDASLFNNRLFQVIFLTIVSKLIFINIHWNFILLFYTINYSHLTENNAYLTCRRGIKELYFL